MTRWQDDKMTGWRDDKMTGWQDDKMTRWQDDRMTRWQDDRMTGWQDDKMTGWKDDKMTRWQDDNMIYSRWQRKNPIKKYISKRKRKTTGRPDALTSKKSSHSSNSKYTFWSSNKTTEDNQRIRLQLLVLYYINLSLIELFFFFLSHTWSCIVFHSCTW